MFNDDQIFEKSEPQQILPGHKLIEIKSSHTKMVTFLDDQNTLFVVDIDKLRKTNKLKKMHFCFEIPNVKEYEITKTLIW